MRIKLDKVHTNKFSHIFMKLDFLYFGKNIFDFYRLFRWSGL